MKKLIHFSMLVVLVLQSFFPAIDALAKEASQAASARLEQGGLPQDATLTPTAEVSPQDEFTPDLTPTPTVEATVTPTETPAVTATPTGTPLPPTPAASVTPMPSPTSGTDLPGEQYQILLETNPEFISPGGQVNLQWHVTGKTLEGLDLVFWLPVDVTLKTDKKQVQGSEKSTEIYRIPAEEKGSLHFDVSPEAEMPVVIEAFLLPQDVDEKSTLLMDTEPLSQAQISLVEKAEISTKGGKIEGLNGKVKVDFSDGALGEAAEIFIHRPLPESMPPNSLSGRPFEINARGVNSGKSLSKFDDEIRIEVDYSYLNVSESQAADLALYWYNEVSGEWEILPSSVDIESKTLSASTTHFTVFDINIHDWQASRLPTLDNFQVSGFTGAGTFSLPIEVPPGPGGLQPSLTLSYNSQVVDQALNFSQASWVGMGWSLDTGMIERNTKGTTGDTRDDTFFLTVNGVSSMIVWDANGFHLADENFWKIEKLENPNSWVVKDKVGNTYYFEYTLAAQYIYDDGTMCGTPAPMVYQWHLTRVRNIYDKELSYTYQKETKTFAYEVRGKNSNGVTVCEFTGVTSTDTAAYPLAIVYPNDRYRVRFELTDRDDYKTDWTSGPANQSFMRKRLSNIYVEQDSGGNGSFETAIRRYELTYAGNDSANLVWPGVVWTAGGKTSTLVKVQEFGLGGASSLPAHTFTYGDNMHLMKAENGYGGRVEFTYEPWVYSGRAARSNTIVNGYGVSQSPTWEEEGRPGSVCTPNGQWFSGFPTIQDGSTECERLGPVGSNRYRLNIYGTVISSTSESNALVRPGGFYRVTAGIYSNGNTISYGLWDGVDQNWEPVAGTGNVFKLPANRETVEMLIRAAVPETSIWSGLEWAKLELVTAVYRVTQKRVYDGRGHEYPSDFSYEGATVNYGEPGGLVTTYCPLMDNNNHVMLYRVDPNCHEFTETNSQFRGHSQVTETQKKKNVDGTYDVVLKTITQYHQGDVLKGRPISVTVTTGDLSTGLLSQQLFKYVGEEDNYVNVIYPVNQPIYAGDCTNCPSYIGLFRSWVRTASQENRIYASDGSYSATRELYSYESPYGNQTQVERQEKIGDDWFTSVRIKTDYATSINTAYLVGLPRQVTQFDSSGNLLGASQYAYDGLEVGQPVAGGKLTTVRSMVELLEPNDRNRYQQVSYEYDAWGNRTIEKTWSGYGKWNASPTTGEQKNTTVFDSIYHTYPVSSENQLPHKTFWSYGLALGLPVTETDPNGAVTSAAYDGFGRLTALARPGDTLASPTIKIAYFDTANPFRIELSQKIEGEQYLTLRRYYDGMGRQFKTETGNTVSGAFSLYNTVQTLFDSATITRQSVPYGPAETPVYSTSETRYEGGKKISTVLAPDGSQSSTVVNGLTTTVTDAAGRETTSQADVWGRTISVTPPEGPGVSYAYDLLGRLTSATRGGATTKIKYDMAGRKIGMDDPDMGIAGSLVDDNWGWAYTYDALGNLTSQIDARGCTLALSYDLLNRLTAKNSSGAGCGIQVNTIYVYDQGANGKGRRTGMQDASTGSGSTTWAYDARGRMTIENKKIDGQTYTTQWTYNSADLPKTMIYPGGEVVTNTYDPNMLLKSVVGADTYIQNTDYDSAGRMTRRTLGNGLAQNYEYYDWAERGGRLQNLKTPSLQNLAYQYDLAGNISQIQDAMNSETQSYGYDSLDRLTSWTLNGTPRETYAYDPATGNLNYRDPAPVQPSPDPHAVGLAAWWGMDENSGSRSNQHQSNSSLVSVGTVAAAAGKRGNAASFSASSGAHLRQADNPLISTGDISFTLAAQVYLNNLDGTGIIANKGEKTDMTRRDYTLSVSSGVFSFRVGNGATSAVVSSPNSAVSDKQWHTVVAWHDAANNTINIQVDNGAVASVAYSGGASDTISPLTVGAFADKTYVLKGCVDELVLHKRILSIEERSWLHNSGQGRSYSDIPVPPPPAPDPDLLYDYGNPAHRHAVTGVGDNSYGYDQNGNQITRTVNDQEFQLAYDAENHLVNVNKNAAIMAAFTYDGDGKQVKSVIDGVTTLYVGAHYEVRGSEITKYYFAGASRIAIRRYTIPVSMTVEYLLSDHLGSTSLTVDKNGVKTSEIKYKPWGEIRSATTTSAVSATPTYRVTNYTFTGQRSYMDDPTTTRATEGFGLMFYNARWYDPALGRFAQADTIIPQQTQGIQAWDRYAYTSNNPIRYMDPSGHFVIGVGVFLGAMAIGAIAGVAYSAYTQSQTGSGQIDGGKVLEAGLGGALIGGGVVIAAAAVSVAVPVVATLVGLASMDGDPTNEVTAAAKHLGATASTACGGDCSDEVQSLTSSGNVLALSPADPYVQEGAAVLKSNPVLPGAYHILARGGENYAVGPGGVKLDAGAIANIVRNDPNYTAGTPVCLATCWGGALDDGLAQQLATKLQVAVYASTTLIRTDFDPEKAGGVWKWFR